MAEMIIAAPVELTDAELDAVAGGANPQALAAAGGAAAGGLVNAGVGVAAAVAANVENIANNNNVAVAVLSGPVVVGP
ncbi:hypothetical protein [Belnapia moabensis]|uniref:hypothetical protein n=1 Tax=Belnapia moabensis TaxID=365533 RepID=UPI0005B9E156|nr:hypothetical protein [Belnapia moabensis]